MSERERSRTPDPPPAAEANGDGGDYDKPAEGGDGGGEGTGDEVKLYVGNLDYATNEDKLRSEFGQFGEVTEVFLPVERNTQRPRGFGFVTFAKRQDAENAISKMDQAQVDGRTIRVNESRPRGSGPGPRGPGGHGGFNTQGKAEVCVCLWGDAVAHIWFSLRSGQTLRGKSLVRFDPRNGPRRF